MGFIIKVVLVAALCCSVIFSCAESTGADNHPTWYTFYMSHVLNPATSRGYQTWSTLKWFRWLNFRDRSLKAHCPKCESLLTNEVNTVFVTSRKNLISSFPQTNVSDSEVSWSTKPFQTYVILNNSVYNCGLQRFGAQLNERGLPIDLIGLDNAGKRLNASDIDAKINCANIGSPKLQNVGEDEVEVANAVVRIDQELLSEKELLEEVAEIPAEDFPEEIPDNDAVAEGEDVRVKRQLPHRTPPYWVRPPYFPRPRLPRPGKPIFRLVRSVDDENAEIENVRVRMQSRGDKPTYLPRPRPPRPGRSIGSLAVSVDDDNAEIGNVRVRRQSRGDKPTYLPRPRPPRPGRSIRSLPVLVDDEIAGIENVRVKRQSRGDKPTYLPRPRPPRPGRSIGSLDVSVDDDNAEVDNVRVRRQSQRPRPPNRPRPPYLPRPRPPRPGRSIGSLAGSFSSAEIPPPSCRPSPCRHPLHACPPVCRPPPFVQHDS